MKCTECRFFQLWPNRNSMGDCVILLPPWVEDKRNNVGHTVDSSVEECDLGVKRDDL